MTAGSEKHGQFDRRASAALLVALIATGAVYLSALGNGFIGLDDDVYITANPFIQKLSAANLWAILTRPYAEFYHPVTMLSLALDRLIWGFDPFGYHLTDVLLHVVSTGLVFWVSFRLVLAGAAGRPRAKTLARTSALVTALLFGLHPLHVESVAWAAQRKDLLCSAFYLLAFGLYLKHAARPPGKVDRVWYRLCLVAFLLSLLSKSMAVTLPVVFVLVDYYPLGRLRRLPRRGMKAEERAAWIEKLPFLGLAFAIAVATVAAQRMGGALRSSAEMPWALRPWLVVHSYAFYLWKAVWPNGLTVLYPIADVRPIHAMIWLCLGALAGIAVVAWLLRRRLPIFGAAFLYYALTLAPVCGLMTFGAQSVADRYSYLPLLGPFLLVGVAVGWINQVGDRGLRPTLRAATAAATALVLLILAYKTNMQIETWRDGETVWTNHLAYYPRSTRSRFNLAVYYQTHGRINRAIEQYRRCLEFAPDSFNANTNLGALLLREKRPESALEHFARAVQVRPDSAGAQNNMGLALLALDRPDEAILHFKQAVERAPGYASAYANLGRAFEATNKTALARRYYERALSLNPRLVTAHERLGFCYLAMKDPDKARREFSRALYLDRRSIDARAGLADLEVAAGHPLRALGHLTRALRYRPNDPNLHLKMAKIVEENGAMGLAEISYLRATAVAPDYYEAFFRLGLFYERRHRYAEALEALTKAWVILQYREEETPVPDELAAALTRVDRAVKGLKPE